MKKSLVILVFSLMIALAGVLNVYATSNNTEDTYLSEEIQELCVKYGDEYGICPELLMAIIESESSGNPKAQNGHCKGLMQINEKYHTERMKTLGVTDIYGIDGNIHLGADYLAELFSENDDLYLVLMCYNMGPGKAQKLYEQGKYSRYALYVSERTEQLERVHGK